MGSSAIDDLRKKYGLDKPTTNGNGHVEPPREIAPPAPKVRDVGAWKLEIGYLFKRAIDVIPEKDRTLVASGSRGNLVDLLVKQARELIAEHHPQYWPVPDLSETEVDEELAELAGRAVEAFQGIYDVPATTDSSVPAADEPVLPEVFVRDKVDFMSWDSLGERRRTHVQNWVVDGWLAKGEVSMWAGKVEHGKTTVMRELAMCVLRGEPFLERPTRQGKVFYAMLDADGEALTYDEFEKMGLTSHDSDNIRFIFEPMLARMKNGPEQLFRYLYEWRPELVIIDPFARLKEIGDFNDYNNTYLMAMLSQYAKLVDAQFALPVHIPRGRPAGSAAATAAFGSVAFGAGVNARFVVERKEGTDVHVLRTSKGKSAGFVAIEGDHVLVRDDTTGRITLGNAWSFKDQARAMIPNVLAFLEHSPDGETFSAASIAQHIGGIPGAIRAAANMLFEGNQIARQGAGKKGSPFTYQKLDDTVQDPESDKQMPGVQQEELYK